MSFRCPIPTRRHVRIALGLGTLLLLATGCFASGKNEKSFFVLHGKTNLDYSDRPIEGLVRVRTLHADAVYEKFQIAVRRNPYELRYDDRHIWVVKPKRMISDFIAKSLKESKRFSGVTRELGETRPDYNLSGNLHAIEIYDSGDLWFAHLAFTLQLTRFKTGEALYFMTFDERRQLSERSFSLAARAMSELLSSAVEKMLGDLDKIASLRRGYQRKAPGTGLSGHPSAERRAPLEVRSDDTDGEKDAKPDEDPAEEVILVPEPH